PRVAQENCPPPRPAPPADPTTTPAGTPRPPNGKVVPKADPAEAESIAKDLLQPDGREAGRPRIDARVDHVRRHDPTELADERAVRREIRGLDYLQAALIDRYFVMRIGAYISVPREVLTDGAHADARHSTDQRFRELRHRVRVRVERAVADDAR